MRPHFHTVQGVSGLIGLGGCLLAIYALVRWQDPSAKKIRQTEAYYQEQQLQLQLDQQRFELQQRVQTDSAALPVKTFVLLIAWASLGGLIVAGSWITIDIYRQRRVPLVHPRDGILPIPRPQLTERDVHTLVMRTIELSTSRLIAQSIATARQEIVRDLMPMLQTLTPLPAAAPPSLETTVTDLVAKWQPTTGGRNILFGTSSSGADVRGDVHSIMHTGLMGNTGGGKTNAMLTVALQLANDPTIDLVIADPHLVQLGLLEDANSLLWDLPTTPQEAVNVLKAVSDEVTRRETLFTQVAADEKLVTGRRPIFDSIAKFNRSAQELGLPGIRTLVCMTDEIKELSLISDEADRAIQHITVSGRKYGVYFIGSSQDWKASVVDTVVRSQFWTRIVLVGSQIRQAAELLEIDVPTARDLVKQLKSPGMAILWRRGQDPELIRFPYLDSESDDVRTLIDQIANRRTTIRQPIPIRKPEVIPGAFTDDTEPRYRCPHCDAPLERSQQVSSAKSKGYCLACKAT